MILFNYWYKYEDTNIHYYYYQYCLFYKLIKQVDVIQIIDGYECLETEDLLEDVAKKPRKIYYKISKIMKDLGWADFGHINDGKFFIGALPNVPWITALRFMKKI